MRLIILMTFQSLLSRTSSISVTPKCIYFTGAGIYYYWQAGAAKYIREKCDITNIAVVGASAGALTSTLLLCDVDFDHATSTAIELAIQNKVFETKTGLAGIWANLIRQWLDELIPEDLSLDKINGQLKIAVTTVKPFGKLLVESYSDRSDLIDACLASCHVPFFLDGNAFTSFRGTPTVDGSLMSFFTKNRANGLPLPAGVLPEEILWMDYWDDEVFMKRKTGNFLSLITPDGAYDMMAAGYDFMRREQEQGRLPIAKVPLDGIRLR